MARVTARAPGLAEAPGALRGLESYAASPRHKAFAAALGADGALHAWAKG